MRPGLLAAVAAGGATGACLRYLVALAIPSPDGPAPGFPWATWTVNVSGSLAMGALLAATLGRSSPHGPLRGFLATGLLASYTTFSAFALEIDGLLRAGEPVTAGVYVLATIVVGLAAAALGTKALRVPEPRRERP